CEKKMFEWQSTFKDGKRTDFDKQTKGFEFFQDENKKNKVVLAYNYLSVESREYETYEQFSSMANDTIKLLMEFCNVSQIIRLGLRYINQIKLPRGNPFSWNTYLDSSLTTNVAKFYGGKESLARAMSQLIVVFEAYKMNYNYGFYNSEYPGKISRKEFALDFDCYTQDVGIGECEKYLTIFNNKITEYFEGYIKDGLRTIMGEK
ncbi:MAG: TIGR04255 family protein, partial [Candidatus Omnitrophica bacterium]|nr:TIGR04255 family protein [Candidatus Omnitrophota bacterium]